MDSVVRGLMYAPTQPDEREHFARCERLRRQITTSRRSGVDLKLAAIARRASAPPERGRLLHRVVTIVRPSRVVEFGSGFGVSGAYIASALDAVGHGHLVTVEHSRRRRRIAAGVAAEAGPGRVTAIAGHFDDHLDLLDGADLFFLDGSHLEDVTLRLFDEARRRMARPAVIVLDDVDGYSADMDRAWARCSQDPEVVVLAAGEGVGILGFGVEALPVPRWARVHWARAGLGIARARLRRVARALHSRRVTTPPASTRLGG